MPTKERIADSFWGAVSTCYDPLLPPFEGSSDCSTPQPLHVVFLAHESAWRVCAVHSRWGSIVAIQEPRAGGHGWTQEIKCLLIILCWTSFPVIFFPMRKGASFFRHKPQPISFKHYSIGLSLCFLHWPLVECCAHKSRRTHPKATRTTTTATGRSDSIYPIARHEEIFRRK
nr:hypothetical protein [Pandoravirus massiliensis]